MKQFINLLSKLKYFLIFSLIVLMQCRQSDQYSEIDPKIMNFFVGTWYTHDDEWDFEYPIEFKNEKKTVSVTFQFVEGEEDYKNVSIYCNQRECFVKYQNKLVLEVEIIRRDKFKIIASEMKILKGFIGETYQRYEENNLLRNAVPAPHKNK